MRLKATIETRGMEPERTFITAISRQDVKPTLVQGSLSFQRSVRLLGETSRSRTTRCNRPDVALAKIRTAADTILGLSPGQARSSAAISSFTIFSMASETRFLRAGSPVLINSSITAGTICHRRP